MKKTDRHYKMSKTLKRRLALSKFKDKDAYSAWKKIMISAEVVEKSYDSGNTSK